MSPFLRAKSVSWTIPLSLYKLCKVKIGKHNKYSLQGTLLIVLAINPVVGASLHAKLKEQESNKDVVINHLDGSQSSHS
jgi:hypothetical protein